MHATKKVVLAVMMAAVLTSKGAMAQKESWVVVVRPIESSAPAPLFLLGLDTVASPPQAPLPRIAYATMKAAADKAKSGTRHDCYNTAVSTIHYAGGAGNGFTWATARAYRGQTIGAGLGAAIADGRLKPGMVVYMSKNPGTDPYSLNLDNLPHWMTYLGKDGKGFDRFADQYKTDWSLSETATHYGSSRLLDEIFDPFLGC